jgi:signal transduction histidine kinase
VLAPLGTDVPASWPTISETSYGVVDMDEGSPDRAGDAGAPRWARVLAWSILGLEVVAYLAFAWLDVRNGGVRSSSEAGPLDALLFLTFPVVGVLLATRRPRIPLGWLMLAIGSFFVSPGAAYARFAAERDLPGAGLSLAVHAPGWVVFVGLCGFLLLLFPDGHLPSTRWRWFAWTCGIGLAALYVVTFLSPASAADYGIAGAPNPFAVDAFAEDGQLSFVLGLFVVAPITVLGGAVALIVRLRRARDPVERLQLRWLAWAASVVAVLYVVGFVPAALGAPTRWRDLAGQIAASAFALIPVAIGIAVLRYRLYSIDLVIRKSVVVAVVAVAIAAVYAGIVVGVGTLVGSRGSPFLSACAAAVVALMFHPMRLRARRLADRIVFGERATPYEVMSSFGDQLAGTYAAADVLPRLARVLGEGIGAERSTVWLVVDGRSRPVAVWPSDADGARPDDFRTEVRHQGEELGALSVAMPANDPMDPAKEALVRDLASQAGAVLSNMRLTEALRAHLDDLRAAQRRLVAAQDDERRRLERNIHDGAQQQLVALAVKARLARAVTPGEAVQAVELLSQIEAETQEALDDLRDLARGIFPPLLADRGLAAALEAQARKAPLPVRVDADGVGRAPQEVEAAVYFSVLEAMQNVAKYAGATAADVRLARDDGALRFTVSDDGRGFDPSATGYGSGLQGMADRLGALGGSLEVESGPGRGTRVEGTIPVDRADPNAAG